MIIHLIGCGKYRGLECRDIKAIPKHSGWRSVTLVYPDLTTRPVEVREDWIFEGSAECYGCLLDMALAGKSSVLCKLACARCTPWAAAA